MTNKTTNRVIAVYMGLTFGINLYFAMTGSIVCAVFAVLIVVFTVVFWVREQGWK